MRNPILDALCLGVLVLLVCGAITLSRKSPTEVIAPTAPFGTAPVEVRFQDPTREDWRDWQSFPEPSSPSSQGICERGGVANAAEVRLKEGLSSLKLTVIPQSGLVIKEVSKGVVEVRRTERGLALAYVGVRSDDKAIAYSCYLVLTK